MINKNILYFTRTMDIGGTEKVIMQLCRNFNEDFNKIVVCSSGGVHEKELKKLGIKHYKINDIENKNPLNIIKTFIKMYQVIKKEDIDIVHTHHRMAAFYASILRRFLKFQFVHTAHNTFQDKRFFTKLALKDANIIAVGKRVKENLNQIYNLNPNKVSVIYNGIEKYKGNIKDVPEIKKFKDAGCFLVGNIGRLSEQKGMEYYINSIPETLKYCKKIMFYIIGDGEDRLKLESLVKELHIENNVLFLGYRDDVINLIKQLDLVVLSSLWEGLPLTPIEAFSEEKTVIATDVDGTGEIVKDRYNGILIESKNSKYITDNIIYLYKNSRIKNELEDNAYKTYLKNFSIVKFNRNYREYYTNLV